jgi:hypothetical protein
LSRNSIAPRERSQQRTTVRGQNSADWRSVIATAHPSRIIALALASAAVILALALLAGGTIININHIDVRW